MIPSVDGILTEDEALASGLAIAALQRPDGMIPWNPGGHCDPWNHVETAMALDVTGLHTEAELAYDWLAATQRPDGSWHNYYLADGIEDAKLDTNVCAYIAVGVWHHWLLTADEACLERLWPVVARAIEWVLELQLPRGEVVWAREVDSTPWDYALLTGSSSIAHALGCAIAMAEVIDEPRPDWELSLVNLVDVIRTRPDAFADKSRWAMDWYYPVLTGVLTGEAATRRLADGWDRFVMEGLGVRCVADEPWVTAAETAECALAHCAAGDVERATASALVDAAPPAARRQLPHRPRASVGHVLPREECTAYTGAAVLLAADALGGATAASGLFTGDHVFAEKPRD